MQPTSLNVRRLSARSTLLAPLLACFSFGTAAAPALAGACPQQPHSPRPAAWATGGEAHGGNTAELQARDSRVEQRRVRLLGNVLFPDGRPAQGAVVVSSAGGLAEVDRDGAFALEVELAEAVETLDLTAVAGVSEGQWTAHRRVEGLGSVGAGHEPPAGTLLLSQGQGCDAGWLPTFGGEPGVGSTVHALAVFDDGSGPALYVAGGFSSAWGQAVNRIARWNGETWSALGTGVNGSLYALAVFDDGSGPALYVGGYFTSAGEQEASSIARWDGSSWSALGTGLSGGSFPTVLALSVFDDGTGPALYVGGNFTSAGGVPANRIARWDGGSWNALGLGVSGGVAPDVRSLGVFDDGSGPALYAGGGFTSAGGQPASLIARWDGSSWSPLGEGVGGGAIQSVWALCVFDDGTGSALYAGGRFTTAGGQPASRIARWDGSTWSTVGQGVNGGSDPAVFALSVMDDGTGSALYAAGRFTAAGGQAANSIARWDGSSWSPLGQGLVDRVMALGASAAGPGPASPPGGHPPAGGGGGGQAASHIARWDGSSWSPLGHGMNGWVQALAVFDDGTGAALYAGGTFTSAGGVAANRIARWDGSSWSPLGEGVGGGTYPAVHALCVFDDGSGPALYVGGYFTSAGQQEASSIARWDGNSWSALGTGLGGVTFPTAFALTVFDDGTGPALYVGGSFITAGDMLMNRIARWDGASWSALGVGLGGGTFPSVRALCVFDDGSRSALYAAGEITSAGGQPVNAIARWDGAAWSAVGQGLIGGGTPWVNALCVFDDGSGPALYAGGRFTSAGGVAASRIARWDGASWSALGTGMSGPPTSQFAEVRALGVFDDGTGPGLYAGGVFAVAGGQAANSIARWDGASWSALGQGLGKVWASGPHALATFDGGSGPALYAGGEFKVSPGGDSYLAKWAGCPPQGFHTLPGCFGNPATLVAQSPSLAIGRLAVFELASQIGGAGWGLLYIGVEGVDGVGCGLFLPGLGEVLLALAPAPIQLTDAPAAGGLAQFRVQVPLEPLWIGLDVSFQSAHVAVFTPGAPLEYSNALSATVVP